MQYCKVIILQLKINFKQKLKKKSNLPFHPSSGDLHVMGSECNLNRVWSFIVASFNLFSWFAGLSLRVELIKQHGNHGVPSFLMRQLPLPRWPVVPHQFSSWSWGWWGDPFGASDAIRLLQDFPDLQPHSCEQAPRLLQISLNVSALLGPNLVRAWLAHLSQ